MAYDVRVMTYQQDNTNGKPNGDSLLVSPGFGREIYAVADGVSRFEKVDNGRSPLAAAQTFCMNVTEELKQQKDLEAAFRTANEGIRKLNVEYGITPETVDYLDNDYVSCVGIAGQLLLDDYASVFMYGAIGDCGLLVFNHKLLTVELVEDARLTHLEQIRDDWGFKNIDERRMFWRREFRNRPASRFMTYGTLTGEEHAIAYLKKGCVYVEKGDTIILFSDGMSPFICDSRFRRCLQHALVKLNNGADRDAFMHGVLHGLTVYPEEQHSKKINDDRAFIAVSV